ncbi:hypothetical protein MKEN_01104500 [Mycena kentingensis (nom. inval.)]|nr:hypothetical protein MKEN_01104500 [Mycena kentingensis (nom. inval.)]
MDSDPSLAPLLNVACRFLPHDQWFTTHVDPDWKVRQVKSWLLSKCLPYAAPPSPPLRQPKKPQRPPSPITFAPDPRHRPISPITFATPKQSPAEDDDVSELDEPPTPDTPPTEPEEEQILPPPLPKKRAILPNASTDPKGDLYSQYTLIRFATGQLLEDDLPLTFYDLQPDELLELHRLGVVIPLPRSDLKRYRDAYWEGWVRLLRLQPAEGDDDSYHLYRVRHLETRSMDWKDRWVVVREGALFIYRDQASRHLQKLSLGDLHGLHNSNHLPVSAPPTSSSNNSRVVLARFLTQPTSNIPTRTSSPLSAIESDSSSPLSSPVFAHDSDDSSRPRRPRPMQRPKRRRRDPEFLMFDLKDDMTYASLLRVLHRHSMPASTFVDSLPIGSEQLQPPAPLTPISAKPSENEAEDEQNENEGGPVLRHPRSLAMLRAPRALTTANLGVLPFPEWRTELLRKAQRAGLGRIGRAVEWLMENEDFTLEDSNAFWFFPGGGATPESPVRSRKSSKRKGKEKARVTRQSTSMDGYDSDVSGDGSYEDGAVAEIGLDSDDEEEDNVDSGSRSENEWQGWMGDLIRQKRVAKEEAEQAKLREEARQIAEEARDRELGLPQTGPVGAEVTVARVGTGVDDRTRRAAMEPTAVVTSLSGINPPLHNPHAHLSHGYTTSTYGGSTSSRMLSSPSSNESFAFAFSPLAAAAELDEEIPIPPHQQVPSQASTSTSSPPGTMRMYPSHSRAHSHTLLHSVSLHDAHAHALTHPHDPETFTRRPSMPVIGSSGTLSWGSRPSSLERDSTRVGSSIAPSASSTTVSVVTEMPVATRPPLVRAASASTSGAKNLLRKKDKEEGKGKEKEKEKERRPKLVVATDTNGAALGSSTLSPPGTPVLPLPVAKDKKKKRNLTRGISQRAEKLVKGLDSALDFVDGK